MQETATQNPVAAGPMGQTVPWAAAWAGTSPWDQVVVQITHIRLLFTTPDLQVCLSSCAHILLLLFLFYFSATDLLLLVVPGVSECLGSSQERSQEWSQDCYDPHVHYGIRQMSFWAWSSPGGHIRLAPCPGPMEPVWGHLTVTPHSACPSGVICLRFTPGWSPQSQVDFF